MKILKKLNANLNNTFAKNFFTLLSGSLLGQVINVAFSPILTRIFTPVEFGYFGVFTSIISILTSVTTLKLEMALPIKVSRKDYNNLFWTCFIINILISIIFCSLFAFTSKDLYGKLNLLEVYDYWWLIGVALLVTGINRLFTSAVVKFKEFKAISKSYLNQMIFKNVFQIGLGLLSPAALILMLGTVINQITSLTNLVRVLQKHEIFKSIKISHKTFVETLKDHKDYIIYGTPSGLANTLGLYLPVPLVMFLYGPVEAGSLSFGITLISMPMRVIGMSLSQVFIGEASEMIRNSQKGIEKLYNGILRKLIYISVGPALFLLLFGNYLFPIVFGNKWEQAGYFIQVLSLCYTLQFISSPLSQILNLLVLQKVQLIWDIFRLAITCICLGMPAYLNMSINVAVIYFSIGMSMAYIVLIVLCRFYLKKYENTIKNKYEK